MSTSHTRVFRTPHYPVAPHKTPRASSYYLSRWLYLASAALFATLLLFTDALVTAL